MIQDNKMWSILGMNSLGKDGYRLVFKFGGRGTGFKNAHFLGRARLGMMMVLIGKAKLSFGS